MKKTAKDFPQVLIGIPTYNEEQNIKNLLQDLLMQDQVNYQISQIIVASDGSTDNTIKVARSVKSPLITVISGPRVGKAKRLTQILHQFTGDCAVILDADTRIIDKAFISKLISPILLGHADLTSASQKESQPVTLVERALHTSMLVLNQAYAEYRQGNNFFTCHGQARAFSTKFSRKLQLPYSSGEDLYTYLYCLNNGFKYKFVPQATTYYRLPSTLPDHIRQSSRFIQSASRIANIFPQKLVEHEMKTPRFLIAKYALINFLLHPLHLILYIGIFIYSRIIAKFSTYLSDNWVISPSSKTVNTV